MASILLIDDDDDLRRVMAMALVNDGHRVREAQDGAKGVAAFHRYSPDIVITDIVMPEMEGIQVIREIRQRKPDVPIIAISGNIRNDFYLRSATALGANTALAKPFTINTLIEVVQNFVNDNDIVIKEECP
jgi:CheY-like chemotaxis protein